MIILGLTAVACDPCQTLPMDSEHIGHVKPHVETRKSRLLNLGKVRSKSEEKNKALEKDDRVEPKAAKQALTVHLMWLAKPSQ